MKKVILFFVLVVAVAGAATFCTLRWMDRHEASDNAVAAHQWLHRELQLTDAQHQALEPIEAKFAENERRLTERLRSANADLARALAEEKAFTPRVTTAVEHVQHCMGDLQNASIEHLFEMRSVLSREQVDKLLVLAQRALEQSP